MKLVCVIFLLVASSLADTCFNGDLYLFTENAGVYQSNSGNGTIDSKNFTTNCSPNGVTNAGNNVILSCYEYGSFTPNLKTISENNIVSSIAYHTPCSINPIAYDETHNFVWGTYLQSYLVNTTYGWYEGSVVAIDLSSGNVVANTSFIWSYYISSPVPISTNGSCTTIINGQYSFVDSKTQNLYTINSRQVAQFDISSGKPVFVEKWTTQNGSVLQGWSFNPQSRMVYAVGGHSLYQFNIDNDWNHVIADADFPSLSSSAMATVDATNSNYLVLQSNGWNYELTTFNFATGNYSNINIDSKLDIRMMIAYQYDACYTPNDDKHDKKIVEIVVPVVVGFVFVAIVVGFVLRRHRHRHSHYEAINSHHHHHHGHH